MKEVLLQYKTVRLENIFSAEETIPMKIREWRNLPEIRKVSLNQTEITEEEHLAWLNKIRKSLSDFVFIIYSDKIPCGVVQLNHYSPERKEAYASAYILKDLAPVGTGIISEYLLNIFFFHHLKGKLLHCEVLGENKRVLRFNQLLGYHIAKTRYEEIKTGKKSSRQMIYEMQMSAEDWHKQSIILEQMI